MHRELSLEECEALLLRQRTGRLAIRDVSGTYIVPVSYAYASGAIHAHTAPGHKLVLLRRWPHVAFQVDEITDESHWRSVLVRGKFREELDPEEQELTRQLLLRAFDGNPMAVTAGHDHDVHLADAHVFRIDAEGISGRALGL